MQTRCPACQTLYRIDEDVLKRAGGQARCFRCDTVFDAYRNPAEPLEGEEPELNPGGDSEELSELSTLHELPDVPHPSAVEPDSELDLSDLAENLRHYRAEPQPEPLQAAAPPEDEPQAEPALEDLPELDRVDAMSGLAEEQAPPPVQPAADHAPGLFAGIAAALLVLLALAQLAWFNRDQVLATPLGQGLAQTACGVLDCDLPPRRAPSRYEVLDRNIGADPQHPGVLLLQLGFRNDADFAQPLPDIQLSLYDSEEQLMARRRLHPDEYLFPVPAPDTLVAPGDVVQMTVRLEDPGRHATGFKLEFL